MRLVAGLLHTASFVLAGIGCLLTPGFAGESRDPLVAAGCVACFLGALALTVLARRRTPRTTEPPPALRYEVAEGEQWRPFPAWDDLPDPVPSAPRPRSWFPPAMPVSDVPPDEVLRRLWMVRAHLDSYRATARYSYSYGGTVLGTMLLAAGALMLAFGLSADQDDPAVRVTGLALAALFLGVGLRWAVFVAADLRAGIRRHRALRAELVRLGAVGAARTSELGQGEG